MGKTLRTTAMILGVLIGIYALILDLTTLYVMFGFMGLVIGFFVSPLIIALIPIYFLFNGFFVPALIIYGGGITCAILDYKGKQLTGEAD